MSTPPPSPSPTSAKPRKKGISTFTKRVVSVSGATIIFVTFLVNDAKREDLKGLVDSIESAENAYEIRTDNRRNYLEIKQFERDFAESRGLHPLAQIASRYGVGPVGLSTVTFDILPSSTTKIDWETLNGMEADSSSVHELIDNIARLANRLPKSSARTAALTSIETEERDIEEKWRQAYYDADAFEGKTDTKEGLAKVEPLNLRIAEVATTFAKHSENVNKASTNILTEAENERETTERNYKWWTIVFYILYALGWAVAVAGIIIGADENKVIEGLEGH